MIKGEICLIVDSNHGIRKGSKIIVCPPTDYFCEAHGTYGWLDSTLKQLKTYTDRKIVIEKNQLRDVNQYHCENNCRVPTP